MSLVPKKRSPILVLALLLLTWLQTAFAYYDPGVQKWLNRDPIQERGGVNLYAFVANAPPNAVDQNGLVGNPGDYVQCVVIDGRVVCMSTPPASGCGGFGNGCGENKHPAPGWQCTGMSQGFPVWQGPPLAPPSKGPPPVVLPPVVPPIPFSICTVNAPPTVITH